MNYPPRLKFLLLLLICILVQFIIIILLVETQKVLYVALFFIWFAVANYLLFNVRCPNCNEPVAFQGKKMGIFFVTGIFGQKKCSCCHDLTK